MGIISLTAMSNKSLSIFVSIFESRGVLHFDPELSLHLCFVVGSKRILALYFSFSFQEKETLKEAIAKELPPSQQSAYFPLLRDCIEQE